jgi:TatD DNase family protein
MFSYAEILKKSFIKKSGEEYVDFINPINSTNSTNQTNQTSPINPTKFSYIDIGCNFASVKYYNKKTLDNLFEKIDSHNKTSNHQIQSVISISNSLKESKQNSYNASLQKFPIDFYYTIGVHPHNAKNFNDEFNNFAEKLLGSEVNTKQIVAIGECGLDYDRMFSTKNEQLIAFELQIELAIKYHKPLYMHCRGNGAFEDFIALLNKYSIMENRPFGVVHCWTGPLKQAEYLTKQHYMLGITGWLLDSRRNADLVETVQNISLDYLMVETDSPWLSIEKGRSSMPLDVIEIVKEIAKIKSLDVEIVANKIFDNTRLFFKV